MELEGKIAIVVGGSRGLGRGAVEALASRGARVVVVGRDAKTLSALANDVNGVTAAAGDATDERSADKLFRETEPDLVVVCAGAHPVLGAFHELTWDEFQTNWNVDAKLAFVWARQAVRQPMRRGGHLVIVSSGAAVQGSPVSGGYFFALPRRSGHPPPVVALRHGVRGSTFAPSLAQPRADPDSHLVQVYFDLGAV
jgi:NAD(P)-dependent dehydrogenase (short-subunit alcohol dehydrogenase family)